MFMVALLGLKKYMKNRPLCFHLDILDNPFSSLNLLHIKFLTISHLLRRAQAKAKKKTGLASQTFR